ncbi:MAG: HEAT repeat domain-containing protein [Clostridia bacterium]|nr:HEAT repeat domain-containing protein [Clostridia bacterium]
MEYVLLTILIVRLTGLLRLRSFEDWILPLMQAHKENIDLQYAGFLALAMMGNRESLIRLYSLPEYTKALSYRSLKEIFHVYSGDKRYLYEKLLDAPDEYIRRIIIKSIGDEGFTEFADRLIPMLNTQDNNLLCDLMRTLGQLKCAAAGDQIAAQMQSDQWTLRNVAVVALAEIDVDRYWDQMVQGLKDREWWVRYNSAKALCKHVPLRKLMAVAAELEDKYATEILNFAIQETLMMNTGVTQA